MRAFSVITRAASEIVVTNEPLAVRPLAVFVLALPPTTNNLFINILKRGRVISPTYRAWKAACPQFAGQMIVGPVTIEYVYTWPDKRKRDGQNYMKAPLDWLVSQGVLQDDNWELVVSEKWSHKGINKINPTVEITIRADNGTN